MTAHADDHSVHATERPPTGGRPRTVERRGPFDPVGSRPIGGRLALGGMVLADGVSLPTVVYAGMLGGMILMHLGGQGGQGGHGRQGEPHGRGGTTPDAEDLSHRSHRAQLGRPGSDEAPEDRASINPNGNERHDHGQHSSHGCH